MAVTRSLFGIGSFFNVNRNFLVSRLNIPTITQYAGIKSKTLEERLGLPEKPKKPLTPYFRFLTKVRPTLKQNNPTASVTDIAKLGALQWEKVDPKLKVELEKEYEKEHEVYVQEKISYDQKLTGEQREDIKQYRLSQVEIKEKRAYKKKMKELGRPKKPCSPFIQFLNAEKTRSQGTLSFREWQLKAAKMWAELNPSEKKILQDKCANDMVQYRKEMSLWEEKMIRAGHTDIVRAESMIVPINKPRKSVPSKSKSTE